MPVLKSLEGQRFGRLVAMSYEKPGRWLCQCDCGKMKAIGSKNLRNGISKSCGCLHKELLAARRKTHGMTDSKTYIVWTNMKQRCLNTGHRAYPDYGGRGIKVCDRWVNSFENFLADMGEVPEGLSLDRKNNDLDYTPENCHWAPWVRQMNNQRKTVRITHEGTTMSMSQWARHLGISYDRLRVRIKADMSFEKAITEC